MGADNGQVRRIADEYLRLAAIGEARSVDDVIAEHPDLENELRLEFAKIEKIRAARQAAEGLTPLSNDTTNRQGFDVRCPACRSATEISSEQSFHAIECSSCGATFSLIMDKADEFSPGMSVGRFTLTYKLGTGGFGTVWAAHDPDLDRSVALKLPIQSRAAVDLEQFLKEAQAVAQLNHPNIVKVLEVGPAESGSFIASELIEGASLKDVLSSGGYSVRQAVILIRKMASALHHAHEQGIIHRDLKPANVLVDLKEEPFLTDFGLARRETTDVTMTVAGNVVGTPTYMSPEQALGERVDRRTDIFSLGVVMFELLTGDVPFKGSSPQRVMKRVAEAVPARLRSIDNAIPADLETICLKCLEKDVDRRFSTAAEVEQELSRYLEGRPINSRAIGPLQRGWRWCKRNPELASVAAGLLATILVASFLVGQNLAQGRVVAAQNEAVKVETVARHMMDARNANIEGLPGYRIQVIDSLKKALLIDSSPATQEAAAREIFASIGRLFGGEPFEVGGFGDNQSIQAIDFDLNLRQTLIGLSDGTLQLYSLDDSSEPIQQWKTSKTLVAAAFETSDSGAGELPQIIALDEEGVLHVNKKDEGSWSKASHRKLGELEGKVRTARFSADRKRVAIVTETQAIAVDLESDKVRKTIAVGDESGSKELRTADVNDRFFAVGFVGNETGVHLFDLKHDTDVEIVVNDGAIYEHGLTISDDGTYLALGCRKTIVYELPQEALDGVPQMVMRIKKDELYSLSLNPDSSMIVTVNQRGEFELRDFQTQEIQSQFVSKEAWENVRFDVAGKYLLLHSKKRFQVWPFFTKERRRLYSHRDTVPTVLYKDGGLPLLTGSNDRTFRIWNSLDRFDEYTSADAIQTIASSKLGYLAMALKGEDEVIRLIGANDYSVLGDVASDVGSPNFIAFHDDGKTLGIAGRLGLQIVQLDVDLKSREVNSKTIAKFSNSQKGPSRREWIVNLAWHGDYVLWTQIVTPRHVAMWKLGEPEENVYDFPGDVKRGGGWHGLASRQGTDEFLYVNQDGQLVLYDLRTKKKTGTIGEVGDFLLPHVSLHPGGRLLAGLSQPDEVSIWDIEDGRRLFTLPKETGAIYSMDWSDDSQLAVGNSIGGVVVWDLLHLTELFREVGIELDDALQQLKKTL